MNNELRQTDCDLCEHEKTRDAEEYQRAHQLFPFNPGSLDEAELVRCADEWRL